jgi:asparagine synthase (glutamine-hydrolysing)
MCGIVGILSLSGAAIDPFVLQRMNNLQRHRGPDGEGYLFAMAQSQGFEHALVESAAQWPSQTAAQVGLAHRRLAILDLSEAGRQPMSSKDGQCWVAFNGEIYNFLDLRRELEEYGLTFASRTDTEVLLAAYLRWGEDCLARLRGMYAFAIWDGRCGRLFCARDRLGIKPFYYARAGDHFIFASEIKSLACFPGIDQSLDDDLALGFLIHGNCDVSQRTLFSAIKALPAAHTLAVEVGAKTLRLARYWQPQGKAVAPADDDTCINHLRSLLSDTIRRHLISDVRVGSCLSGGLDSSTVVALAGKIWHERPEAAAAIGDRLHTFTSCYDDRAIDERAYALLIARSAGARAHLVFPSAEDFWADFERLAWHQDMPFAGLSYYAQWRVMRAAKEAGIKVLLDGQGGDEVFGGYAKFRYAYLASLLREGRVWRMWREFIAMLRQGDRYTLDLRNGYRYLPAWLRRFFRVDSLLRGALKADWTRLVASDSTPAGRWWRNAASRPNNGAGRSLVQRIQVDDLLTDTLPQLLRMEDRSSMAFSLEARVPLLDHCVVEYGLGLPDHWKIQNGWSKWAIREAMQGVMPDEVRLRKSKLGFAAPDRAWLAETLRAPVNELLAGQLRCQKYVDVAALRRWYGSPQSRSANAESYLGLFRVLSLEMWMRAFNAA